MTKIHTKRLALLITAAVALGAAACTRDRAMDDGGMMHEPGSMNKTDAGKNISPDRPMMKE